MVERTIKLIVPISRSSSFGKSALPHSFSIRTALSGLPICCTEGNGGGGTATLLAAKPSGTLDGSCASAGAAIPPIAASTHKAKGAQRGSDEGGLDLPANGRMRRSPSRISRSNIDADFLLIDRRQQAIRLRAPLPSSRLGQLSVRARRSDPRSARIAFGAEE